VTLGRLSSLRYHFGPTRPVHQGESESGGVARSFDEISVVGLRFLNT